jgi:hypothetical protein
MCWLRTVERLLTTAPRPSLPLLPCCWLLQVGSSEIVSRVVEDLKDEAEPYRWVMTHDTIPATAARIRATAAAACHKQ